MKDVKATLLLMLTVALVLSCSQTLEFTARGPVTFRNYSTKVITEVSAFWEGIPGGKAIVLKFQNGTKVTIAAGSVETPAVASIEAAHYFPNACDVT